MAYCTAADIKAMLSETVFNRGLKDGNTGDADAMFVQVAQLASDDVDSILEAAFSVPIAAPYPVVVVRAARVFACDLICRRRGTADRDNPWEKSASDMRDQLEAIAGGRRPLNLTVARSGGVGSIEDVELDYEDDTKESV